MNRDLSTMIRKIDEAGIKIDESRFFAEWPTLHAQIVSRQLSMQSVMELARAGKWTPSETT
jgi:oligoribonuclease (3'-5' exoribonuclease)